MKHKFHQGERRKKEGRKEGRKERKKQASSVGEKYVCTSKMR
jgi:hypothetical protein